MKLFDLHCDTATALYHKNLSFDNSVTHINAPPLADHRLTQCFAVFFDENSPLPPKELLRAVAEEILPTLKRENLRPILTAEGAGALAEEADWIDLLQGYGCAMASLVWNGKNSLATGALTDDKAPLTPEGRRVIEEWVRRGIVPDVSHLSAAGTDEILSLTQAPVAASHSNARACRNHPRNLTDSAAQEIFRRGGLVGLNLYPPFLSESHATVDDILRHAEHFLSLGGETGLALGCDLDGVESLPEGIRGFADLPLLYQRFCTAFGADLADRIFYKNAARFFGRE